MSWLVIGACIEVHRRLGPGLLEAAERHNYTQRCRPIRWAKVDPFEHRLAELELAVQHPAAAEEA